MVLQRCYWSFYEYEIYKIRIRQKVYLKWSIIITQGKHPLFDGNAQDLLKSVLYLQVQKESADEKCFWVERSCGYEVQESELFYGFRNQDV